MKGERKLRLVRGGAPSSGNPAGSPQNALIGSASEAPPTEEELGAAEALRRAMEERADPLAEALASAHAPEHLAMPDLDAIVERALGNEAASTVAEVGAAERLRTELDQEEAPGDGDATTIARALRAAAKPAPLDEARHEAILGEALRAPLRRRRAPVRRIAPATALSLVTVAALAAGVALFVGRPSSPSGAATASLVRARSAADLFDAATPFPRTGQESARVDRIASARAADLRTNRFAAWGVK